MQGKRPDQHTEESRLAAYNERAGDSDSEGDQQLGQKRSRGDDNFSGQKQARTSGQDQVRQRSDSEGDRSRGDDFEVAKANKYSDEEESRSEGRQRAGSDNSAKGDVNPEDAGKTELFVRGIGQDTNEDGLRSIFERYGDLTKCKHLSFKGVAFVEYADHHHAVKALNAVNCTELDGCVLQVQFSGDRPQGDRPQQQRGEPSATVFCGNLGFRTDEDSVARFFEQVGPVAQVRIAKNEENRPKGFCHVEFQNVEDAKKAVDSLNGQDLDGRNVRLDLSANGGGGRGRGGFRGGRGGDRGGRGGGFRGGGDRYGGDRPSYGDRRGGGGFRGGDRDGGRGDRPSYGGDRDRRDGGGFRGGNRDRDGGDRRGGFGGGRGGGGFGGDRRGGGGDRGRGGFQERRY